MNTVHRLSEVRSFEYATAAGRYWGQHYYSGKKARILIMPDWEGAHSEWAQEISAQYAATCDAEVILTDHYGADNRLPDFNNAYAFNEELFADPLRTRELLRGIVAALEPKWKGGGPLIVVGFCSGGAFSFETGRSGAAVDAAICIHGNPQSVLPMVKPGNPPFFTVIHGANDPVISQEQLSAFQVEMQSAGAAWTLHIISGAKHSFTRFDSRRESYAVGYSRRAEVEARQVVKAQIAFMTEMSR